MQQNVSNIKMENKRISTDVIQLFHDQKLVKVCAPMVRYSKLQFRNLVRMYNCDLCFTPMILADSFCKSEKARHNEFTTNSLDTPLITQFAANTIHDFVGAAYLVSPFCDGIDLNCGCPQRWAKQLGLGCSLLKNPQKIYDIVRQTSNTVPKPFTISVKMRISSNIKETAEICKQLEMCGVSFLTIHARTSSQLTGNINLDALRFICEQSRIPILANGGLKTLEDCFEIQLKTNCNGVMVANGILNNPTLFNGSNSTTLDCVQNWLNICYNSTITEREEYKTIKEKPFNLTFQCFHHHLVFMLEKILSRKERQIFNNLQTFHDVLEYLEQYLKIRPKLYSVEDFCRNQPLKVDYSGREKMYNDLKPLKVSSEEIIYDYSETNGKFFESKIKQDDFCDWSNIFLEND